MPRFLKSLFTAFLQRGHDACPPQQPLTVSEEIESARAVQVDPLCESGAVSFDVGLINNVVQVPHNASVASMLAARSI